MGCGSSHAKSGVADSVVPGASPNLPSTAPTTTGSAAAAATSSSPSADSAKPRMDRTQTVLSETDRGDVLKRMDQKVCILVSDMAGFTKETRQHGIIHFASKILRMRQILHPVLLRHSPLVVETEADNFLVFFDTIQEGVECALDMTACLDAYNRRWLGSDPEQKRMRIELGGIGIDWGEVTLEAPSGAMYGMAADGAFLLGEDVSNGEILLTHRVKDELKLHHKQWLDESLKLTRKDDPTLIYEHLQKHYFIAQARKKKPASKYGSLDKAASEAEKKLEKKLELSRANQLWSWAWSDCEDASYIGADCVWLTKRHAFEMESAARAMLDEQIAAKFMGERDLVVCMFGLQTGLVTQRADISTAFRLKHHILELLEPIIESHGGRCVEDTFLVFEHAFQSVACALAMSARVAAYNAGAPESERIDPKAFGIHSGKMLIVPNTNVHWGDCVSTASKLGEDLGETGEVLVSDRVWKEVAALPAFSGPQLQVIPKELETSGVKFAAFSIKGALHPEHPLPIVELHYSAALIAREALARGEGPEELPSGFVNPSVLVAGATASPSLGPKKPASGSRKQTADGADSVLEDAPISRQIFAGPKRTVTLLDYQRVGRPGNSDRGSLFSLPSGSIGVSGGGGGGGAGGSSSASHVAQHVEVAAGVMSPNLAHALLVRHNTGNANGSGNNSPALPPLAAAPKLGKSKSSRRSSAEAGAVPAISVTAAMSPAARAASIASTSPSNAAAAAAAAAAASSSPSAAASSSPSSSSPTATSAAAVAAAGAGVGRVSPILSPDGQERRLSLRQKALVAEAQARLSDAEAQTMMRLKQRRSFEAAQESETHLGTTVRAFDNKPKSTRSRPGSATNSKPGSRRASLKTDGTPITLLEAVTAANAAAAAAAAASGASPSADGEQKESSPSVGASQRRSLSKPVDSPAHAQAQAASLSWPASPVAAAAPPLAIVVVSDDKPRRRSGSTKAGTDGKPRRRSSSKKDPSSSDAASAATAAAVPAPTDREAPRRSSGSTKEKSSKRASLAELMTKAEAADAAPPAALSASASPEPTRPIVAPAAASVPPAVQAPRSLAPLKPSASPPPTQPLPPVKIGAAPAVAPPRPIVALAPKSAPAVTAVAVAAPSAARAATKSVESSSNSRSAKENGISSESDGEE